MRLVYALILFPFTLLFFSLEGSVYATELEQPVLISEYKEDITGNGLKETIKLKGNLLSPTSNYYHSVWIEIISQDANKWTIAYEGGYEPNISFIDMKNNDGKSILFQSNTQENEYTYYRLHTMKNEILQEDQLPRQHFISGSFNEDFIVDLKISPFKSPIKIHVEDRANDYIEKNIYNVNGDLLIDQEVITNSSLHYEPIFISDTNGYGLKSFQPIGGINHEDILGQIETLWYFENDQWVILHSKWTSLEHEEK